MPIFDLPCMCVQHIKPRHEKDQNARCWDEHTKFAVKIIDRKKNGPT